MLSQTCACNVDVGQTQHYLLWERVSEWGKREVDNVWARNCNYSIHFPINHEVCAPIGYSNVMIENYWKNCVTIIFRKDNFMNFNFFLLMIFFCDCTLRKFCAGLFDVAIEYALFTSYVIFFVRFYNFSCSNFFCD